LGGASSAASAVPPNGTVLAERTALLDDFIACLL
jgi:hypothetical protein